MANRNINNYDFIMYIMNKIKILRELENFPLFTINDFARLINTSNKYVRTYLQRLEKEELIIRVERGKYTVHEDPLIYCSHIVYPSYISMWSTFALKGLTEQILREIMIVTSVSKSELNTVSSVISFTKSKHCFGYTKEIYQGHEVFIASVEKAVIDSLLYKKVPFSEIIKAIDNSEISSDKIIEFVLKIGSSSLAKRVGFLLERNGVDMDKLLDIIDYNYILLDADGSKTGEFDKKWRLIINDN
jgi:predicted transcriptional regulator of viral defense system